jgi:membrane peptidoglycan carboxypeptidase
VKNNSNYYEGKLVKFQPDTVSGWHSYEVANAAKEVPADVLRQMLDDGIITKAQYKYFINNK